MGYDNDWYDKPKPLRKPKSNIVTFQIQPNHHLIPIKAHNPPINPPFHSLSLSFCKEEKKHQTKGNFSPLFSIIFYQSKHERNYTSSHQALHNSTRLQ